MGRLRSVVKAFLPYGLVEWRRRSLIRRPDAVSVATRTEPLSLESRTLPDLFPGVESAEVLLPLSEVLRNNFMVSPVRELAALAAMCCFTRPERIFEFGTYIGSATLVMAMNAGPDCLVDTLDLPPEERPSGYDPFEVGVAFRSSRYAKNIVQHYGDSRSMDWSGREGTYDLVFVDADHSYECVRNDSLIALRMVRPGGVVVWDDYIYTKEHPECAGVARYLSELNRTISCVHVAETRLAMTQVNQLPAGV